MFLPCFIDFFFRFSSFHFSHAAPPTQATAIRMLVPLNPPTPVCSTRRAAWTSRSAARSAQTPRARSSRSARSTDRSAWRPVTGSVYANGCLTTLNVAFTGPLTAGTSFPFVADAPVPEGKSYLTYSEMCGSDTKAWRATAGSMSLDSVTPPAQGLTTGKVSYTVTGATMAPAHMGGGTAAGTFNAAGSSKDITYTGT